MTFYSSTTDVGLADSDTFGRDTRVSLIMPLCSYL
jgi:hypothetical protein